MYLTFPLGRQSVLVCHLRQIRSDLKVPELRIKFEDMISVNMLLYIHIYIYIYMYMHIKQSEYFLR